LKEVPSHMHTRTWTVEIVISEHDEERLTRAEARLHSGVRPPLRGEGEARRSPADREVPEIGDELATARALARPGVQAAGCHGRRHRAIHPATRSTDVLGEP
jgi:hypothetical protein